MMAYPVRIARDQGNLVTATCRDLPEAVTGGARDEIIELAADALDEAIAARMAAREEVPIPSRARRGEKAVALPTLSEAKVLLYREMRRQQVTKAELARRLGWNQKQADRVLNLRHASRFDQVDAAFSALNRRLGITVG